MKAFSNEQATGVYPGEEEEALASQWNAQRDARASLEQQEEMEQHFEKVYTDPAYFESIAKDPRIAEAEKHALKPDEVRYGAANRSFLSYLTGRELGGIEYEAVRGAYTKKEFGKHNVHVTDKEFYGLVKEQYEVKQKRRAASVDLYTGAIKQTLEDTLAGTSTSTVEMFAKWKEKNADIVSDDESLQFFANGRRIVNQAREDIRQVAPAAARVWQSLVKYNEGEASEEDVRALGAELVAMSRADRKKAFDYAAMAAQASGEDGAGVIEQAARNLEKSLTRGFSWLESPFRLTNIGPLSVPTMAYTPLWRIEQEASVRMRQLQRDDDLRTSPEKQSEFAEAQRTLEMANVVRELKDLAANGLDPIKPVFPEGTISGTIERGAYGAAGSIGYMTATAVSPFLGLAVISDTEYDRARRENPDMNPHAARAASLVSGSIQTLLEMAQIRTYSAIGSALRNIQNGVLSTAAKVGTGLVKENVQEAMQDAVSDGIPLLMSHLREDMPNQDTYKLMTAYVKERPEVFFSTLFLAPFGIMGNEIFKGDIAADRALSYLGFNGEQRKKIMNSPDPQAAYSAEIEKRSEASIKKGIKLQEADLAQVQEFQDNPATPTLESEVLSDGTREWRVIRHDPRDASPQPEFLSDAELQDKTVTLNAVDPTTGQAQQIVLPAEVGHAMVKRNVESYQKLIDCLVK